ncbi:hypothetical protein EI94DRAFT_1708114 [Lactarius quietus]|nr:hypothetical protein EI94DRAFT_1708114 [Lactarius quietus]
MAHHLNATSSFISDALSPFLSTDISQPLPVSVKENIKWSHLLINGIPTGVTDSRGAFEPSECHDALVVDNPIYRALHLTQLPFWVWSSSSLVIVFEDPDGETLKALLTSRTLFAFGHTGKLKCWKQKPQGKPRGADTSQTPSL